MANSFEITVYRGRTSTHVFTLYEDDGTTGIALSETDDIARFKFGRRNTSTPDLDIDSIDKLANGSRLSISKFTSPAEVTLTIAQDDTSSLIPGVYTGDLSVIKGLVTSPIADPILTVSKGIVYVMGTLAGDTGTS